MYLSGVSNSGLIKITNSEEGNGPGLLDTTPHKAGAFPTPSSKFKPDYRLPELL